MCVKSEEKSEIELNSKTRELFPKQCRSWSLSRICRGTGYRIEDLAKRPNPDQKKITAMRIFKFFLILNLQIKILFLF